MVVTVKVAVVFPAFTVTEVGTVADELLLDSVMMTPPVGAAELRVSVPVEELPPATEVGFSETEDSPTGGVIVRDAILDTLL